MSKPEQPAGRDLAFLVRGFAPQQQPGTACPDPNVLCGYAEGRLLDEERSAVEAHVAQCEACRSAAAVIATNGPEATRGRAWWRRWPPVVWLAAALLVGTAAAFAPWLAARLRPVADTTEARLVAAARALAAGEPALFAAFQPLGREERLATGTRTERGGEGLSEPGGRILDPRPTFRWEAPGGGATCEVALSTADGTPLWRTAAEGTALQFPREQPDLRPGRYLWRLLVKGPLGNDTSARTFEVADADARQAWLLAVQAIEQRYPDELGALLRAHYALRNGLLAEAVTAARSYLARNPDDGVGRQTMFRALTELGETEAAAGFRLEPPDQHNK